LKSGSLNLLEPSGPVQACNGIALPRCARNVARVVGKINALSVLKERYHFEDLGVDEGQY
jgi:hypothetical protein